MKEHKLYKYQVYDSNANPETVYAHTYDVTNDYVNFDFVGVGLIATFYKPISVYCNGEYKENEKTQDI